MNDRFFELKKEKQDRMINAACSVLALNGYANASTDEIVKAASISKGLLFHYFGSKRGMYAFIFDFSVRYAELELRSAIREPSSDFFKLLEQLLSANVTILRQYPCLLLFLESARLETDPELTALMEGRAESYYNTCMNYMNKAEIPDGFTRSKMRLASEILHHTAMHYMRSGLTAGNFDPDLFEDYLLSCITLFRS